MILKRYIFSQLFFLTCLITVVLTGAIWLTQSLRFVDIIVTRGVSFGTFLSFIFFLLPNLITLALPIAFLMGVLMVYNKLITDHELVVMRTSGCSDLFLMHPLLTLASLLVIFLYGLTLYFLPLSFQKFREMELRLRHHYSSALIRPGEFTAFGNVMIYVQQRTPDGALNGILLYDGRDPKHEVTITAEKGLILDEEEDVQFVLIKGTRQEMDRPHARPSFLKFDQYVLRLQPPQKAAQRELKPYEMTLSQLFYPRHDLPLFMREKMRSEGHQRLISPLYTLSFGVIAALFLLRARNRRGGHPMALLGSIIACALLQGGSLILLQHTAELSFAVLGAYGLVLSPLLFMGAQVVEAVKA